MSHLKDDIIVDVEMYYTQIINLVEMMLEQNNDKQSNLLTIRDLAHLGYEKIKKLN